MNATVSDAGRVAHALSLLEAVARSESSLDAEVPLRCARAVSLLRAAGVPPTPAQQLDDNPAAIVSALRDALAAFGTSPPAASSDLILEAVRETRRAARCAELG